MLNTWLEIIAIKWNLKNKDILEIGIGGDEKPSGSYRYFGEGNNWTTMDINPKWKPDIIGDITNNSIKDNSYDLVIMTQTLEHIWDFKKAIEELHRITRKYVLLDCPWMWGFHRDIVREETPTHEWDDYWRISPSALYKLLKDIGFKNVIIKFKEYLTLCIAEK